MRTGKFRRLFLFIKACAVIFIAYFLLYFALDLVLGLYLSGLEKEYISLRDSFERNHQQKERKSDPRFTGDLEKIIKEAGFNLRNFGTKGNNASIDNFFQMNHRFLESVLETPDGSSAFPDAVLLENMGALEDRALLIRELLLRNDDVLWADGGAREIDLLKVGQIGEWMAAESLRYSSEGRPLEAALFAEALKRLSLSLLANRSQDYWLTACSLAQTHSGVVRKTGGSYSDIDGLDIAPYYRALRETILLQAERMISGTRRMGKIHYYKMHRREGMVWRTYGRLWFRYSLIREIKARLGDYRDSADFLSCGSLRPAGAQRMKRTIWMMNGGEFRTEDMRFRLQKLCLSFELTKWVVSVKAGIPVKSGGGFLDCPGMKTIERTEGDTLVIGYETPFEMKKHLGVIDIPNYYRLKKAPGAGM